MPLGLWLGLQASHTPVDPVLPRHEPLQHDPLVLLPRGTGSYASTRGIKKARVHRTLAL